MSRRLGTIASDDEVRAITPVPYQPPMFAVLTAPRVTREALQDVATIQRDPESTVRIALNLADLRRRWTMFLKPFPPRDIEGRFALVPIEIF